MKLGKVIAYPRNYPHPAMIRFSDSADGQVKIAEVFHTASYDAKDTACRMVKCWNEYDQLIALRDSWGLTLMEIGLLAREIKGRHAANVIASKVMDALALCEAGAPKERG